VGAAGLSVGHIAAAVAVAVVSAGGAVEVHQTLAPPRHHAPAHHAVAHAASAALRAPVVVSGSAAAIERETDAARRHDAALRVRLRLVPNATAGKPVAAVVAPALDPAAMEPGNGGAAAPAEPPADGLDPVEPPVAEDPV